MSKYVVLLIGSLVMACGLQGIAVADITKVTEEDQSRRNVTVYRMLVTPAMPGQPVFRHRLTVEPHKTIAGNAITHYLRSLGENSLDTPWRGAVDQFGQEVYSWYSLETNPKDIPLDNLKTAAGYFDSYVENHLRRATQCRDADWGLAVEDLRGPETVEFLLPSVQQTRSMARALLLRNRLAIIEGRYEDSVDHLRMTYQLGQNVNRLPLLVTSLVAIAQVGMANEGMLDLIAAKDSPNMYWPLAELPQPIIDVRGSFRLESSFSERYFAGLLDIEDAEYTKERWNKELKQLIKSLNALGQMTSPTSRVNTVDPELMSFAAGLAGYGDAKQRLLDAGMASEKVEQMPVAQVLLIDAARDVRLLQDEFAKAYFVPYTQMKQFEQRIEKRLRAESKTRIGAMIVDMLMPATIQVRRAEIRVQAQINVLMAMESLRSHAAKHGKFPASLSDLELPVRNNPQTGEPIDYQVNGQTAVIKLEDVYRQRFEITIAPK